MNTEFIITTVPAAATSPALYFQNSFPKRNNFFAEMISSIENYTRRKLKDLKRDNVLPVTNR